MIYAFVFALFAAFFAAIAFLAGGWGWLLAWPALSCAVIAAGYAGLGPRILGKRDDGRLSLLRCVVLLPYLVLAWSVWHLRRLVSREPCCHEVAPGLWLGRRPLARDLPEGVVLIVDLTAEFWPAYGVRVGRDYLTLPTLDADWPDEARLRACVARVAAHAGPVYVHCALGHGRSALLVAAVLLARGLAADDREAVRTLRAVRPGVYLTGRQRWLLRRLAEGNSLPPQDAVTGDAS
jgi:protein-tyrosine phosphatase